MSWPWSTIGLPEQSTPAEIRAARESWLAQQGAESDPDERKHIERAFHLALEIAEQRDPSHLHHSEFPDPWKDSDAASPGQLPALRPEHPPLPSADMLATTVLGLVRQSPDFDAFAAALSRVLGPRSPAHVDGPRVDPVPVPAPLAMLSFAMLGLLAASRRSGRGRHRTLPQRSTTASDHDVEERCQ